MRTLFDHVESGDESYMVPHLFPEGFEWINQPVTVRGEDFSYEATCLCSFPKSSGKVRYIVEDNGRLFIQRKEQLTFKSNKAILQSKRQPEYSPGEWRHNQDTRLVKSWRQNPLAKRGCPQCGHTHPPGGVCLAPNSDEDSDPLGR